MATQQQEPRTEDQPLGQRVARLEGMVELIVTEIIALRSDVRRIYTLMIGGFFALAGLIVTLYGLIIGLYFAD